MKAIFTLFVFQLTFVESAILYYTDFESFSTGSGEWGNTTGNGREGWVSNDINSGAQSIDEIPSLSALGKTASIGFGQPSNLTTTVSKDFNYAPSGTNLKRIQIRSLIGLNDSDNGRRDDFYLVLKGSSGQRLAAIRFDNNDISTAGTRYRLWRENGDNDFSTLGEGLYGQTYNLTLLIDLEDNKWSAFLGDIRIFNDEVFTANVTGSEAVVLGSVSFEWVLGSNNVSEYGNNYLLIADFRFRTVPEGGLPFEFSSITSNTSGDTVL